MSSYSKSSEFVFSVNKYDQVRSQYYTYYDSVDVALCDNVWPSWVGITVKKKRFPQGFNYEPINPFKNLYQGTRYWLESKYFVSWVTNLIWTDFFFLCVYFFYNRLFINSVPFPSPAVICSFGPGNAPVCIGHNAYKSLMCYSIWH